ncbi:hypothetical protein [Spirosoma litoris]
MNPTTPANAVYRELAKNWFGVPLDKIGHFMQFNSNSSVFNKIILYGIGLLLTPITLAGYLLGYTRAYNRFMKPFGEYPLLYPLRPIVRFAIFVGAILVWVLIFWMRTLLRVVAAVIIQKHLLNNL